MRPLSTQSSSHIMMRGVRRLAAIAAAAAVVTASMVGIPAMAEAETDANLPQTVSADFIPTPQLNGVAWDLRVRGNIAYVVGSFTRARPSGVAPGGAGEVVRNNGMAFNITTGQILDWNPNFNAPVLDIEFAPDGSRFYAGGQFTAVGGQARSKLAEFTTSTGALTPLNTSVGGSVETLAITTDSIYLGGSFNSVANQSRRNLAKINRTSGALLAWAPAADDIVHGIIATDESKRVVIGGRFQNLGGQPKVGIGALDADSAAPLPWSSTPVPAKLSNDERAWVVDLKLYHGVIYAANNGQGWHWFDGRWAADYATGDLKWLDNCYGSTSSITVMGQVVYSTPHAHDCSSLNGFPEESPTIWKRALAETAYATGTDTTAPSNNSLVSNQPIPTLLHWYPSLNTGTYTGQYQGGWAMDNNGDYLVLGGEFTRLNEINQQGLAVFPSRQLSPNAQRPVYTAALKPSVLAQSAGTVRVAWPSTWDYDDENLTYELLRDNSLTAIDTQKADSIWWKPQALGYRDSGLAPGSTHTYRVRVTDPWGNNYIGPRSEPVIVGSAAPNPFATALAQAGARHYYPLNEQSGTTAYDHLGFVDAQASAELQHGVEGAIDADTASGFSGQSLATGSVTTAPDVFSTQMWFKTTTTTGGKLIGFGNASTGASSSYDRHIWMDNSGRLHFGTWLGWPAVVDSSSSYNDGEWHQVTATLGAAGMYLYVDGLQVAGRADVTSGQSYSGVWRIGSDNLNGWPQQPSSSEFTGIIDEAALFDTQLPGSAVLELYQASGRTADIPEPPTDSYGKAVYEDAPQSYWRLDEIEGTAARDITTAKNDATIYGAVGLGEDSALAAGHSMAFGGSDAVVVANQAQQNPQVFTVEAWFNTNSVSGGKIIGFGNASSGLSTSYDRHVYLRNDGTLAFGVYTGVENIAATSKSYNDGKWHHLAATLSDQGMKLYVDGALSASNPQTQAEPYNGYWRVGGDRVWGGANSAWFDGLIDEAAVYPRALSAAEVDEHYSLIGAPNQQPDAVFSSTTNGLNAAFDASGSQDPDGSIIGYDWDFGDGSSEQTTTAGISHSYAQAGSYTVTLRVHDDRGASASTTAQMQVKAVNQPPQAVISSEQTGLKVVFDASGSQDPDGELASYHWDFGDGTEPATKARAEHRYESDGSYTVTLTVTDADGAQAQSSTELVVANAAPVAALEAAVDALTVHVDADGSADPEGGALEYAWDFGDGASSTQATASHEYQQPGSYEIRLKVTDDHGASDTTTHQVTVKAPNSAPQAAITSNVQGLKVSFSAADSLDADGQITDYRWDFGDGATASGAEVEHEYAAKGSWQVKLTVTDDQGATATAQALVAVQDPAELDPTAAFTMTAEQLQVEVDASDSKPPAAGGEITAYRWDFGDGSTADSQNAQHSYEQAGTYSITLTVFSGERENTISQALTVNVAVGPNAQFTTELKGRTLKVDAASSSAGDAGLSSYRWDFGDGDTATGANAEHHYAEDGNYTVKLTVGDSNGLEDTASMTLQVTNAAPVPAFTLGSSGLNITVDAGASGDPDGQLDSYHWDFGDGHEGSGKTASHSYAKPGKYTVVLQVVDNDGARAELSQQVELSEVVEAQVLAADSFERTEANGWGSADTGGSWLRSGTAANFAVNQGRGAIKMSSAGSGPMIWLPVQLREIDLRLKLSQDKAATGGGIYQSVILRDIPGVGSYRAKVRLLSNGSVALTFEKVLAGNVSALTPETVIGQVTGGVGTPLLLRVQMEGIQGTTLRAKVYNQGNQEPSDWQLSTADATGALQTDGRLGLSVYLSGSANNAPIWGGFDDLSVRELLHSQQ